MGLMSPGMPLSCCCCCGGDVCCVLPPFQSEFDLIWSPCPVAGDHGVWKPDGNEAVDGYSLGWFDAVGSYTGPAIATPDASSLVTLSTFFEAVDPVWVEDASSVGGALSCPAAFMLPVGGKLSGPCGLALNDELNPGSVWMLFDVPSGTPDATVMRAAGVADSELWIVGIHSGSLFVSNGDLSVVQTLGTVSAGQLILLGLEFDPNTPSYRAWANGITTASAGFPAGCSGHMALASSVPGQGGWSLYLAAYLWGLDWDGQVAMMEQWATDTELVLTPPSSP